MIRALLLSRNDQFTQGGEQLVTQWRAAGDSFLWLDIEGEISPEVRTLLQGMGCDDLAITDCARTRHPPKVENFGANCFILFRGITALDDALNLVPQQIAIWVGCNYLITVHRGTSVSIDHMFHPEPGAQPIQLRSPDIVALQLLHYVAGRYLEKLMTAEERIADLEQELLETQSDEVLKELVGFRSRLRTLCRIFNYHQRVADTILNDDMLHLGKAESDSYHIRRDLYDRCERLSSLCTLYYELCGDLVDGFISLSSHRLNNTMKILTIITAIFVPITFIAGLYGMNFDNMPELHHAYGYFGALGAMGIVATAMLVLFRRINWL